jgi:hypothetical protein
MRVYRSPPDRGVQPWLNARTSIQAQPSLAKRSPGAQAGLPTRGTLEFYDNEA